MYICCVFFVCKKVSLVFLHSSGYQGQFFIGNLFSFLPCLSQLLTVFNLEQLTWHCNELHCLTSNANFAILQNFQQQNKSLLFCTELTQVEAEIRVEWNCSGENDEAVQPELNVYWVQLISLLKNLSEYLWKYL